MEKFNELKLTQKERFRVATNKLLSNCFILKKKEDTKEEYYFILNNKELFSEYFAMSGFELVVNESFGVISLTNNFGTNRVKLKKVESIILLILRLLYVEGRKSLYQTEDVIITMEDIHTKINMLRVLEKTIDKTTLKASFSMMRRFNFLEIIDRDVTDNECRIKLYPSILFGVNNENILTLSEEINDKISTYKKGDEREDDEEAEQD